MNCKPGDLAIIIRGLESQSPAIGRIVKVLQLAGNNPKLGPFWTIEFSRPVPIVIVKKNLERVECIGLRNTCHCPDAWLRPIRPDAENLDTDTDTDTEAAISHPCALEPA